MSGMLMRSRLPLAAAPLLGLVVLVGTTASASGQTVDDIVARHIAARGGKDKLAALQTIKIDAYRGQRYRDDTPGDRVQEAPSPHARRAGAGSTGRDHDPARHQPRRGVGPGAGQGRAAPAAAGRRGPRSRWRLRRTAHRLARKRALGRVRRARNPARRRDAQAHGHAEERSRTHRLSGRDRPSWIGAIRASSTCRMAGSSISRSTSTTGARSKA